MTTNLKLHLLRFFQLIVKNNYLFKYFFIFFNVKLLNSSKYLYFRGL